MKKTICICLFVAGLFIVGMTAGLNRKGIFGKIQPQEKNGIEKPKEEAESVVGTEEVTSQELAESMAIPKDYAYVIFARDGLLVVYKKNSETEYFETNIRVSDLEEKLAENLEKGIYFFNDQDLYDFLESYSS